MADSKLTNVREFTSKLVEIMEDLKGKSVTCHVSVEDTGYINGRGYTFSRNYVSGKTKFSDSGYEDNQLNLNETLDSAVKSIEPGENYPVRFGPVKEDGNRIRQDVTILNGNITQKPVETKKLDLTHRPDGYFPPIKSESMDAYRKKADEEAFRGN